MNNLITSISTVELAVASETSVLNPSRLSATSSKAALTDHVGVAAACAAASAHASSWAAVPAPLRGKTMGNLARIVEANLEQLAGIICDEIGKPLHEARGEVQEIIDTCEFFASEGRRLYGQTVPSELPAKQLMVNRQPLGCVFIITASNFPAAVPSWYFVPALVCGNTVVWKASEAAPRTAHALAEMVHAAGVPKEALHLILADGANTQAGLTAALEANTVQKIGFTGSTEVGREISALAGRFLQRPTLELGGKNPMVVTASADIDLAVEGALFSGFGTAGQRCTSLGSVIVESAVRDSFISALLQRLYTAVIGDPRQNVLCGPMINERTMQRYLDQLDELIEPHHIVRTNRGRITPDNARANFLGDPSDGLFVHPVIVENVQVEDRIANIETFGPVVNIIEVPDFQAAVDASNAHPYGLSAAIYTNDPKQAWEFVARNRAGMISVCNTTSGAEAHLPFGGNGASGNGSRQSGVWVIEEFSRWQSVNWDWAGKLQRAQMDTSVLSGDLTFKLQP
jgi:acyl-CoA reductase-like NAD-dependent aldehyde dehydrogenase